MDNNENEAKSKRPIIIWSVITFVVLVIIGLAIYFVVHSTDAKGQIKDFKEAVKNKEYNKVSSYLSNGERDLSKTEAKAFVHYMEKPDNKKRFNDELDKIQTNIDKDKQYKVEVLLQS